MATSSAASCQSIRSGCVESWRTSFVGLSVAAWPAALTDFLLRHGEFTVLFRDGRRWRWL